VAASFAAARSSAPPGARAVAVATSAAASAARCAVLCACLLPAPAAADPLTLAAALQRAVERSEALRAARAGVAGATETARAAGQLPDPNLRVGVENLPVTGPDAFSTARDFMTMKRIGISQEWVPQHKRALREAAARATVGRESVLAATATADTRLQTALAYLDAWFAEQGLELATQAERYLREAYETARARLAASAGGSPEVLALQAARGMAEDDTADIRQQRAIAAVALQRWVGVPPGTLAAVDRLPVPAEADWVAAHPTVLALERDVEVARQAAAVAAKERSPNWTWELAYSQRSGYSDMVSFGVSIPLQIAPERRQDRDTASRLAQLDRVQAELEEATRAAQAEYRSLAGDTDRLQARIARYRDAVLAPAQQRTAAALAAYRSNQAPLTALFDARNAHLDSQRRLLGLQRELARTEARLAFRPLDAGDAR
jgi:outer membrane protein TolC